MSRILVTGGNGVLGRVLVEKLARSGHSVRVMSRKPRPVGIAAELVHDGINPPTVA